MYLRSSFINNFQIEIPSCLDERYIYIHDVENVKVLQIIPAKCEFECFSAFTDRLNNAVFFDEEVFIASDTNMLQCQWKIRHQIQNYFAGIIVTFSSNFRL